MKFTVAVIVAILLPVSLCGQTRKDADRVKTGLVKCDACHLEFASVLPKGHKEVKGKGPIAIDACLACHAPGRSAVVGKNVFSAPLHRAHLTGNAALDCAACHIWKPGKSFGLPNRPVSFGKPSRKELAIVRPIYSSWASSSFTDALHAKANITCTGCHGKNFPEEGDSVEKERCQSCHGSYEVLAAKTEPSDFPERNPHRSHMREMECAVCHKAHTASSVYCLTCHQNFQMSIAGAGDQASDK